MEHSGTYALRAAKEEGRRLGYMDAVRDLRTLACGHKVHDKCFRDHYADLLAARYRELFEKGGAK